MFPLILSFCFSIELGLIFQVWVFSRISVFACLAYPGGRYPFPVRMDYGITSAGATLLFEHGNRTKNSLLQRTFFILVVYLFPMFSPIAELRHLMHADKGHPLKIPVSYRSTVFRWWQDELFKSADNTRILLFTLRPTQWKNLQKFGGFNDVLSDIRSNQISTSTRCVFGTVYPKTS